MKYITTLTFKNFDYEVYENFHVIHAGSIHTEYEVTNGFTTHKIWCKKNPTYNDNMMVCAFIKYLHNDMILGG